MSCVPLQHRFPEASNESEDLLSWSNIATLVRKHAHVLPGREADEMLSFADLLEGFAELDK
jgi:hypothetical protein